MTFYYLLSKAFVMTLFCQNRLLWIKPQESPYVTTVGKNQKMTQFTVPATA
ncbi:MAG: hypothetical protein J0H81_00680 [Sphingopyxis terrae]|nr:hypothetical protein [Sphingopyxis terrae]